MKRREVIWVLLVVVVPIGAVFLTQFPPEEPVRVTSKVSRVKADHRSLASGLEAYFAELHAYPPHTFVTNEGVNAFAGPVFPPNFSTFRLLSDKYKGATLTTPTAYTTNYFPDPFFKVRGATFGYYTVGETDYAGWILYSPGPDGDYDFETKFYDPKISQPSPTLITGPTYDPTNGTMSDGDVWRVKQ